jgi:predicted phosphodiesterase
VRFAILSDIQGNIAALHAVLDEIARREDVGRTLTTGDLVGLGPHPNEVIDTLRDQKIDSVKGNYDDAIAFERISSGVDFADESAERVDRAAVAWTRRRLTPENMEYLQKLPFDLRILETGGTLSIRANEPDEHLKDMRRNILTRVFVGSLAERRVKIQPRRVLIVHGSPRALNEFIRPETANSLLEAVAYSAKADVVVSGHSGVSFSREHKGVTYVGVGSVSGPRTRPGEAEFVILDLAEEVTADFIRVEYDPKSHLDAIAREGLPPALAARFDLTSL